MVDGIQLGELGGFGSVPRAVNFAQDGVGRGRDDPGLRVPSALMSFTV